MRHRLHSTPLRDRHRHVPLEPPPGIPCASTCIPTIHWQAVVPARDLGEPLPCPACTSERPPRGTTGDPRDRTRHPLPSTRAPQLSPSNLLDMSRQTAIDAGVPIVAINVRGAKAYDYGKALKLMRFLDKELDVRNPGASAVPCESTGWNHWRRHGSSPASCPVSRPLRMMPAVSHKPGPVCMVPCR